jgi:membrane fusion protein, multidrug efflux system
MRQTSTRVALVLVLALPLVAGCRRERGEGATHQRPTAVAVQTVVEEPIVEQRRLTGDVTPWEILPLSFKVGGRVARLLVEEGDRVKAGQLVALLDGKDYKLVRDLARTQVESLQPHLRRAEKLQSEAALPAAKLEELQGKMDAARIQHQQARAQLSYAVLRAPMAGLVLMRRVAVGDLVDPSRPVAVLADLRRVKVMLGVPQRDLPRVRKGMRLELSAVGVERALSGVVHNIGYAADPKTRTFPMTVEVGNEDLALRAGMVVEARVEVGRSRGVLLPLEVVSRDALGRPRVLLVGRDRRAEERVVTLGEVHGERVVVASGLRVGEEVVLGGLVSPGDLLNVVSAPSSPTARGAGEAAHGAVAP